LDVTRIYAVADQLPAGTPLIRHRPFRAPHHTISHDSLVGDGNIPKSCEISLAHHGVLFLDEFPEFGTCVLEVMRQPRQRITYILCKLSTYLGHASLPLRILRRYTIAMRLHL
jgi:predicted ATPase with chaperone activity